MAARHQFAGLSKYCGTRARISSTGWAAPPVSHCVLIGFVQGVRHHLDQRIAEPGIVSVHEAEGGRGRWLRATGLPDEWRLPEVTGLGWFQINV